MKKFNLLTMILPDNLRFQASLHTFSKNNGNIRFNNLEKIKISIDLYKRTLINLWSNNNEQNYSKSRRCRTVL